MSEESTSLAAPGDVRAPKEAEAVLFYHMLLNMKDESKKAVSAFAVHGTVLTLPFSPSIDLTHRF